MEDTQQDIQELEDKLSSKRWRMTSWEFYKIKNKEWEIVSFVPNKFQLYYLKNKHTRNIILKARQMGFSTVIQLDYLDDALFNSNFSVGIIAQDRETAGIIRKDKIEVALDNLPDFVKWYREYDKQNSKEITFSNGSSIYVSNSFRWWTLQRLHISEYGKICAKRPAKADEIRTWAIEAVAQWQEVTIESTAEWNDWDFFDKCEEYYKMIWKPLAPLDYKFLFFPRWLETTYSYEWVVVTIPQDVEVYFKKLEDEYWVELTQWQKNWYYLKLKQLRDQMKREYPSVYKEAFEVAIEWSYLQTEINMMYQDNRLTSVPYDHNLPVYTSWDIWWAWWWDDMTVRFFQMYWFEIRWIDYREWSWYSMTYVLENIIDQKPYNYAAHIWPHDMKVHSLMTGKTRIDSAKDLWYDFTLVGSPAGAVSNRIDLMRKLFPRSWFDHKKCLPWINKLKNYKRKRDDTNGCRTDQVHKNGSQHAADWFGYGCQYIDETLLEKISEKKETHENMWMYSQFKESIK